MSNDDFRRKLGRAVVSPPTRPDLYAEEYSSHANAPRIVDVPSAFMALLLAIVVNSLVWANISIPIIRPAAGFWYIVVLPIYLLYTTNSWRRCAQEERLAYSVCAVLLALMLGGLGISTMLPIIGVHNSLGVHKILVLVDVINVGLYVVRSRYPDHDRTKVLSVVATIGREEMRLIVMAACAVVLSVLGANHLNNGAGGQPTLIALLIVTIVILLSLRWLRLLRDAVVYVVIYLLSLSLLLSTSLRGWYVSGHDIQEEYHVFQLTAVNSHWSMSYWHDAYNACLSITILPTELSRLVDVDDPYVFKLFFQLMFSLCPVLVYGISQRYFNRTISVLAVAYFIGFPTFFTDMPFLNRQEIGLLFVCSGAFLATNKTWTWRRRQIGLVIAGAGVEISHYSSMYVFFGVLIIAWTFRSTASLITGIGSRESPDVSKQNSRRAFAFRATLTLGPILALIGIIFLWGSLVTGTSGQVVSAGESAVSGLGGNSAATRSGNVSFSLLGGGTISPSQVLQNYRKTSISKTSASPAGLYLPKQAVSKATTPYVSPQNLPLTRFGEVLHAFGIPIVAINALTRNLIAYCEQLFLLVGLVHLLIMRRREKRTVGGELFWLAIGSVCMLGLITVLPSISADYGVLRAFQEALIFLSPVIVIGSATLFKPLGMRRAEIASAVVCLGLFVNTNGLVPQSLGGNLAELNLNNSGAYYDLYYMRPQDNSAVAWLESQPRVKEFPIQSTYLQTKYLFTSPSALYGTQAITDSYPPLVLKSSWVILGDPTVGSDLAYTFTPSNGDLIAYKYPIALLDNYKNLVYTNGETAIYK
jgi:uncharacterized membrane protein